MYRITASNTKPEIADDFNVSVPTADGFISSGRWYVWYYAKGNAGYADSEIAGPVEVTILIAM